MSHIEAMKLALEALDNLLYWDNGKSEYDEARKALANGRQAIARAEGTSEEEDPDKATTKLLDGGKWKTRNQFNPDWNVVATMSEEVQRLAKRVEELEAEKAKEQEPVALEAVYETIIQWDEGGSMTQITIDKSVIEPPKDWQLHLFYCPTAERWYPFINDAHYQNTIGSHQIMALAPVQAKEQELIIQSYLEKDNSDADRFCDANCTWSEHHKDCKYASQRPVPQEHKPLTDEQIEKLCPQFDDPMRREMWIIGFKAAHGIGEKK